MANRNTAQRDRDRAAIAASKPPCYLCGEPIDYTLPYLHPMSFVVDHIIPLARAKDDAHRRQLDTLANKAAAHRECNSKKRARDYAPIIRRSNSLD